MGTSGGGCNVGGGGQRFCLRWNNHQSNLLSVFDQLLHDEAFVDVTLAVDGRLLRAHKMVLSACSPYFQSLFVGHPDRHPIVILKDVPYSDMRSLLDFMYRGEVSVDQERLTAFLKVAESLRIKGLTEVNEERCDLPSIASSLLSAPPVVPPPPPNLHRIHPAHLAQAHKRALPPMAANPLLGSALTAPKRKRGRPRKLSGGSNDPPPMANAHDLNEHDMRLMHPDRSDSPGMGPPDLLEVNMGEGDDHPHPLPHPHSHSHPHHRQQQHSHHQLDHNDLDTASLLEAADDSDSADHTGAGTDDEVEEVDEKPPPPTTTAGIKQEPTPGTSTAQETEFQGNGPSSKEESYMPDPLRVNVCESLSYDSLGGEISIKMEPPLATEREGGTDRDPLALSPDVDPDDPSLTPVQSLFASGVHFLSHASSEPLLAAALKGGKGTGGSDGTDRPPDSASVRRELLEYLIQPDGTVVCKWCGEVLPSRTHWYRHKYKFHVQSPPGTASLFKCYRCNVFFKSRKGYHGHVTARHSGIVDKPSKEAKEEVKRCERDGEGVEAVAPMTRGRRSAKHDEIPVEEYEKQREKEEKLVADIIEKVKKECEAAGSTVTRRGYTRRQTVMNS